MAYIWLLCLHKITVSVCFLCCFSVGVIAFVLHVLSAEIQDKPYNMHLDANV